MTNDELRAATIPKQTLSLSIDAALGLGVATALLYFIGRAKDVAFCRYFELPHEEFGLPPDALIAEGFRVIWGRLWLAVYLLPLIAAAVFYLGNYGRVLVRRFKPERAAVRRTLYVAMIAALPVLGLAILRGFTIAAKNDGDDIANKWQVRHSPVALQVKAGLELHGSLIRTL